IGQCSASSPTPGASMHRPSALNTWPLTTSPTGTEMGAPVSVTGAPRTRPSVGCIEMLRTMSSPRCRATSRVRVWASPAPVTSTCRALNNGGTPPRGNSMSTTGPMTRTTRPVVGGASVVVMESVLFISGCGESVGAADNLGEFLGDLRLPGLVGLPTEVLDDVVRVVRRGLAGGPTGCRLAGRGVQQRRVDPGLEILRQHLVQQQIRRRLELVGRQQRPGGRVGLDVLDLHRRHSPRLRPLGDHRDEMR